MEKCSKNILSTNDPFETKASIDDTGNSATPLFVLMCDFAQYKAIMFESPKEGGEQTD